MDITISNIGIKAVNNRFFDLFDRNGQTLLTDYYFLNKNIVISDKNGDIELELSGKKNRSKLTSVNELKNTFAELVLAVVQIIHSEFMSYISEDYGIYCEGEESQLVFDCSDLDKDLLVEQLIFDILFDEYLAKSEKISRWKYSVDMSKILNNGDGNAESDVICKKIESAMKEYYNLMKYSQLREELSQLGVIPDRYVEYLNPKVKDNLEKNKLKSMWDYYFCNRMPITGKQFQRKLKKDSNTSYESIIKDLYYYNQIVEKILPAESKSSEEYFNMSMDYYYLESYKRVDFIFKLINFIPKTKITEIDRNHFLVKRFHPKVLLPFDEDGKICYGIKHKYYRPLFVIEDKIHKQMQDSNKCDDVFYGNLLLKYQIVRAKTYELFKYHKEFVLTDYGDVSNFIRQNYNMRSYHESNEIWKEINKDIEWKRMGNETKQQMMILIQNFISISNALFWESPKRKNNIP